jgi:hypothetical protein
MQTLRSAWLSAIVDYPGAYLQHRLDVVAWQLGFHDVTRCLPFHFGVSDEPADMARALRLDHATTKAATTLWEWESRRLFLYRPFAYMLVGMGVIGYLLLRRAEGDAPIILLQFAGLAYVAAYLVIGVACDFRYVYFMVLSVLVGVAYVSMSVFARGARKRRVA